MYKRLKAVVVVLLLCGLMAMSYVNHVEVEQPKSVTQIVKKDKLPEPSIWMKVYRLMVDIENYTGDFYEEPGRYER